MVSVIVTTKDQQEHVTQCVQSIIDQDYDKDFEIILIDDSSDPETVEIVRSKFADRVKVITKPEPSGWLDSLAKACDVSKEDTLVFFDPHCIAGPHWLKTIRSLFESDSELSILTGPLYHGNGFIPKLAALTLEAAFLSQERQHITYVGDDNFSIKKDVLRRLLEKLPVDQKVIDSVGSVLLASEIKRQALTVLYEPQIAVFHISPPSFGKYLYRLSNYSSHTSIRSRQLDPSMRGAKWLTYPVGAACIFASAKFVQDIRNTFHFRKHLGLRLWQIPLILCASAIARVYYFLGLYKMLRQ